MLNANMCESLVLHITHDSIISHGRLQSIAVAVMKHTNTVMTQAQALEVCFLAEGCSLTQLLRLCNSDGRAFPATFGANQRTKRLHESRGEAKAVPEPLCTGRSIRSISPASFTCTLQGCFCCVQQLDQVG